MFPLDTKQTVFTIEFAVAAYAHYMGMDHEEAGKEMAAPDFMGGLTFIEKTPRGLYFKACPDSPGFYSKETIRKAIREGKAPDGENKLLIQAKRFVHVLDEKGAELDFSLADFDSFDDFANFPNDAEEVYSWLQDERNSVNVARHERDDARAQVKEKDAEIERLKQENAELEKQQAVYAILIPGSDKFQPRVAAIAHINAAINPPTRQRDLGDAIKAHLYANGVSSTLRPETINCLKWTIPSRQCGKGLSEGDDWVREYLGYRPK